MTGESAAPASAETAASQRIDKWLWCARFFRTRSVAAKFVAGGGVRLTRAAATQRIEKPSALVRPGDSIAFALGPRLRVIEICALADRRGPASEARALYNDNSPPPPLKRETVRSAGVREKGAGRPTKKDRRALDALKSTGER
ncbi:MAG: RNA-binding S4 domain-containing protein [Parvularculaceae bacterium]